MGGLPGDATRTAAEVDCRVAAPHFYAAPYKQAIRDRVGAALERGAALIVTECGTAATDGEAPINAAGTRIWWDRWDAQGISLLTLAVARQGGGIGGTQARRRVRRGLAR